MPQASEAMRAIWGGECGVGEDKAEAHLRGNGWTLTRQWEWRRPTPDYEPTDDDIGAINFLICEWDYGGIAQ